MSAILSRLQCVKAHKMCITTTSRWLNACTLVWFMINLSVPGSEYFWIANPMKWKYPVHEYCVHYLLVIFCGKGNHSLRWCHNGCDGVSNHQPYVCLLNRLFRRWSKKTSKFRVTGLCAGNSPVTGEFPTQMASNAENISIWWRHHVVQYFKYTRAKKKSYEAFAW